MLAPATSNSFQSTSIPSFLNICPASSAIASNPPVARAKIVGPAPDKQIPSRPGWLDGVMFGVTSDRPGIWNEWVNICPHAANEHELGVFDMADVHDP